jgi:hypothetical protein
MDASRILCAIKIYFRNDRNIQADIVTSISLTALPRLFFQKYTQDAPEFANIKKLMRSCNRRIGLSRIRRAEPCGRKAVGRRQAFEHVAFEIASRLRALNGEMAGGYLNDSSKANNLVIDFSSARGGGGAGYLIKRWRATHTRPAHGSAPARENG